MKFNIFNKSEESKDINVDSLENYIHLFLMDINRLILQVPAYCTYNEYESREKGYGKALLKGYHKAFTTPLKKGKITPAFIKMVHKYAASHLSDVEPGCYRKEPGNFALRLNLPMVLCKETCAPSASLSGIIEFIDRWFIKETKPVHTLHFAPEYDDNKPDYILICKKKKLVLSSPTEPTQDFNLKSDFSKLIKLFTDPAYDFNINSTPDEGNLLKDSGYSDDKIADIISEKAQLICDKYNAAIDRAISSTQKRRALITLCVEIEQLHLFPDCNARVCRIVMDRLLHEVGQPLVLHMDINRLDGFSIEELEKFIVAGQKRYLALCSGQLQEINDDLYTGPGKISPESTIIPDAKEEINNFKKIVYDNLHKVKSLDFMVYHHFTSLAYPSKKDNFLKLTESNDMLRELRLNQSMAQAK